MAGIGVEMNVQLTYCVDDEAVVDVEEIVFVLVD